MPSKLFFKKRCNISSFCIKLRVVLKICCYSCNELWTIVKKVENWYIQMKYRTSIYLNMILIIKQAVLLFSTT